jgi:hypothetical protein
VDGDAEDVDSSGADLHHEQDVEPAQADGVSLTGVGGWSSPSKTPHSSSM